MTSCPGSIAKKGDFVELDVTGVPEIDPNVMGLTIGFANVALPLLGGGVGLVVVGLAAGVVALIEVVDVMGLAGIVVLEAVVVVGLVDVVVVFAADLAAGLTEFVVFAFFAVVLVVGFEGRELFGGFSPIDRMYRVFAVLGGFGPGGSPGAVLMTGQDLHSNLNRIRFFCRSSCSIGGYCLPLRSSTIFQTLSQNSL
jgi:hypothetical protein